MSSLSRRKGAGFEREIARRIRKTLGVPADRALNEVRDGNTGDIDAPDLPIAWQLKCGKRPPIYRAIREAEEAAEGTGKVPVGVVKRSGSGSRPPEELAVLRFDDFLELVAGLRAAGWWA